MIAYLTHLEKTAALTSGQARAIEALVGGVVGAGVGAGAGRMIYSPKTPLRGPDAAGVVRERFLTPGETKDRRKSTLIGAGAGAAALIPAALIASHLRGKSITKAEAAAVDDIVAKYLGGLRRYRKSVTRMLGNEEQLVQSLGRPGDLPTTRAWKKMLTNEAEIEARKTIEGATKLQESEATTLRALAEEAKKIREATPFRGLGTMPHKLLGRLGRMPSESRHEGQVLKHLLERAQEGEVLKRMAGEEGKDPRSVVFDFVPAYWERRVREVGRA